MKAVESRLKRVGCTNSMYKLSVYSAAGKLILLNGEKYWLILELPADLVK